MMKGLMGRCLNHETALDHIRKRDNETEDELSSLKAWKVGMDKNLLRRRVLGRRLSKKWSRWKKS